MACLMMPHSPTRVDRSLQALLTRAGVGGHKHVRYPTSHTQRSRSWRCLVFVVATGHRTVAENAFVRITADGGAVGFGEMAPFPEVGGESRSCCLDTAARIAPTLLGRPLLEYRRLAHELFELASTHPAVR